MSRKKREEWERLPKESDPAWEAFVTYRDMPEETGMKRSHARVGKKLSKSTAIIDRWASRYEWAKRCAAYDDYRDEIERTERIKRQKKRIQDEEAMDQRHVSLAVELQRQVLANIREASEGQITLEPKEIESLTRALKNLTEIEQTGMHTTSADKHLELSREMFEYQKERDAGANIEYEDLSDVEKSVYGEDEDSGDAEDD